MMMAAGFQLGEGGTGDIVFMLKTVGCWSMQPEMITATSMHIFNTFSVVCLFLVYVSGKP
jgi:hypothetical protein